MNLDMNPPKEVNEQAKFTNEILAVQQTSLWFLPEVLMEVERCGPKTRLSIAGGESFIAARVV